MYPNYDYYNYNGGRGWGKTFQMNQIVQNTHAEICPVCHGSGMYSEYNFICGQSTGSIDFKITRMCHGCGGKGWVVVATVYGIR